MRGIDVLFITFEGPDGAGKSTQLRLLAEHLRADGMAYIQTREPGGTAISDQIRTLVLDPEHKEMASETEALLYAAARAQHVTEVIQPALRAGYVVLCDRFVDASIAYQGYGLRLDVGQVGAMNEFATGGLVPDRSYILDLSPETGMRRMLARDEERQTGLDRIEQKQLAYHERVREAFHFLYENNRHRIYLLDAEKEKLALSADIYADFRRLWTQIQQKGEV